MKARRGPIVGIFAAVSVLGALVAASAIAGAAPTRRAGPVSGGTVIIAEPPQTNIPWYLPLQNGPNYSGYVEQLVNLLYQPLLFQNPNHQFDFSQSIAQKITYNKQGTVYNVFMNPKWHWSNGTPITATDAQFSWNVLLAAEASTTSPWPAGAQGSGGLPGNAQSFAIDNPYEFTVTLKKPANQAWFEYNGLSSMPIMPAVWNKYPTNMAEELAYLGKGAVNPTFDSPVSGPFKLQSAVQNQAWTLVPNANYSGHKAYISRLILQYEGSDASVFAGLKTGAVQLGDLPSADWAARAELPDHIVPGYGYGFGFIWVNLWPNAQNGVNQIFANLYVRQAMEDGIDQNSIGQIIYHNQYQPAYGPLDAFPKTAFLDPTLAKPLYPYNPAAGMKLLEAHGWQDVNGVMTKGSHTLQFTMQYSAGDIAITEEMELIQADWAKEGIKVTLEPVPFAALLGTVSTKHNAWQIVGGITWGYPGYPSGEQLFYKDQGVDFAGYDNAQENALVNATIAPAANAAANLKTYFAWQLFTAQQLPMLWAPLPVTDQEVAANLQGVTTYTLNSWTDWMPQYWWLGSSK